MQYEIFHFEMFKNYKSVAVRATAVVSNSV